MNKNKTHYLDRVGPCQAQNLFSRTGQGRTLSIITILLLLIISTFALPTIKAQTPTPTSQASQDVDMSATIQVPSEEVSSPTPIPAPTEMPPTKPSPTPTPTPTKISKVKFKIFGYAPANIPVSLTGKNVLELTTSSENGYFEFNNVPLPETNISLKFYPELCLQAYYKEVSTQPVCLPKTPTGQEEYNIGPVLLSPIIVIENQETTAKSQIKAVGKAIPNSPIQVYLAKESRQSILNLLKNIKLIQKVSAYYLPKYEVKSDEKGNFEFNLPTDSQAKWRLFTAYTFQNQNSPKSNTLSYEVKSPLLEFLNKIMQYLINLVLSEPIMAFIILEVILLCILTYLNIRKDRRARNIKGRKKKKSLKSN